jgi:ABC-2 type transport system permease protein
MNKKTKAKSKLGVVLAWEFRKMAFNKAFVLTTLLGPFLIAAITVLPSVIAMKAMTGSQDSLKVGVFATDSSRGNIELLVVPAFSARGWDVTVSADADALRASVVDQTLDGYLSLPDSFPSEDPSVAPTWFTTSSTDITLFSTVEDIVSDIIVSSRIAVSGDDETRIRALIKPVSMSVFKVSSDASATDSETDEGDFVGALLTALAFCMLIYMTVLLYGQQIGRSVVSEKSSKIVDILLSSVRSEDLLYGKLLGIGLAGIVQYAVWIGFASIILWVVGPVLHMQIPVKIGADNLAMLMLFFIGGYLLFSSLYAACGSASEDDQHMAQLAMPLIFLLVIPMIMMQSIIQRPDSTIAIVLSYVPFTSPMVMLIRTLVSPVPGWSIALSVAILALSVIVTIKIAAKIFRVGILMTGKNFSLKDIAVWLRK